MSDHAPDRSRDPIPARASAGLRLRLWLACMTGALVAAGGIWWVVGTQTGPSGQVDPALVVSWLGAVAGLALIVGAAFALWLDRGIVLHVRALAHAIESRQISHLRGLPGSPGWGELSLLTQQIQQLLSRHREIEQGAEELGLLRDQLLGLRQALEHWIVEERWVEILPDSGPSGPVVEALNRGFQRWEQVREQNLAAARQVAAETERALDLARESAEQAERGFVEATALLTTVRELQRLGQELTQSVVEQTAAAPLEATVAASARSAIEALVEGTTATVDRLTQGIRKAEALADLVPLLANRATLIALDRSLGGAVIPEPEQVEETRRLVLEVRAAVDRATALTRELEADVSAASAEMRSVRERIARQLETIEPPSSSRRLDEVSRLMDRVREMIQDATRKGERLSATGERGSRAAEGLMRTLEGDAREMAGLITRLAPPTSAAERAPSSPRPASLRLLDHEEARPEGRESSGSPGAGEEPR